MPAISIDAVTRQEFAQQLASARQRTDDLFAIVRPDSIYERPISERHRIVFYIGHLEAFDWNLLRDTVPGLKTFHPEFDCLFAFGIDPIGGGLPDDKPSDWPSIAAVRDYVESVRALLDQRLPDALDSNAGRDGFPLTTLLNVAIEHRLMHAETLAYMFHQLPLDRKIAQPEQVVTSSSPVYQQSIEIPAGAVTLGLPRSGGAFGWDNEFSAHTVDVPAFAIDQFKVTNGEFLEFMDAGGYESRWLWRADDWEWRVQNKISHPAFWIRAGDQWLYRTMFKDVPLPLEWPVYVSHAEAQAYANWKGKALPTEAEWQRAAYCAPNEEQRFYPWGSEAPSSNFSTSRFGNFDFANWSPVPVNAHPAGQSAFGVQDMLGNGWEWTSTQFAPFPGFEPFPFYRGYSADFFDGKHFVMKGGSARTAASMLRPTFRNWFQAHYQFVYAGFRCVSR